MEFEDSLARRLKSGLNNLRLHPWLIVFCLVWLSFFVLQNRHLHLPAYHDGRYWYEKAAQIAEQPWFPFVRYYDAGHPPLVPWMVALGWQLPLPRLPMMHAVLWIFPALLVTSVFEVTRRLFGLVAAIGSGILTAFHPSVVAQALQFNFDLPIAAFCWLAVVGAVVGSPWLLAGGLTLMTLSKLNGMFLLGPFMIYAVFRLSWRGELLKPRAIFHSFWPLVLPLVIFAVYHAIKYVAVGHVFDTGEFESGQQIAMVASMWDYGYRVFNNIMQSLNHNGNWFAMALLGVLVPVSVIVGLLPENRQCVWRWWLNRPGGKNSGDFWAPLSRAELLLLAWLIVLVQVALQALRSVFALERYFIVCYPVLYISIMGLVAGLVAGKCRAVLAGVLVLPLAFVFLLKWHPSHLDPFPSPVRDALVNPPDDVCTNFEQTLEFPGLFVMTRHALDYIDRHHPGEPRYLDVWWPFDLVVTDPSQGLTKTPHHLGYHPGLGGPEFRFVFSHWACGKTPEQVEEESPHYHRGRLEERGRMWLLVLRHDSLRESTAAGEWGSSD